MSTHPPEASFPSAELRGLLDGCCDQRLDERELERLKELMLTDRSARHAYLDWMTVEAELRVRNAQNQSLTPAEEHAIVAAGTRAATGVGPRSLSRAAWAALAASLVGVALLSGWRLPGGWTRNEPVALITPQTQQPIATITATQNCRWRDNALGYGAKLADGDRVELLTGVAEITTTGGAKLLLEGPGDLLVRGDSPSVLRGGRLTVHAPADSAPFALATRRMQFDHGGADFGVVVGRSGGGELHVFGGSVVAKMIDDRGEPAQEVTLTAHQAVRVAGHDPAVAVFEADEDRFVRSLDSTPGPRNGLYAYEGFDYGPGQLAQQNGGFGWAGPWFDLETADAPGDDPTNRVGRGSLNYPALVPHGNKAAQVDQQNRVRRTLAASVGGVFDTAGLVEIQDGQRLVGSAGKTLYLSFLQRVSAVDDGFYGVELHRGDGNPNRVLCIGNGAEGSGYGVTSNYNGYGRDNYLKLGAESDRVNLIVVRIDFGQDNSDTATVYRNPQSLVDESVCQPAGMLLGNFAFDRVCFGNFDQSKLHEVDELRIATVFHAATGRRDLPDHASSRAMARLRSPTDGPRMAATFAALLAHQ
ncbi:hypothetical protein Pla123a_31920 [Posidoniimonas polymericola]|uniref:FecR protein n=1 Tax=Posidoniimonas polymericola TaxID=2528002 RepID=A0A5C5YLC9_9BACT|nr:hypothetical protein [Posidoniimonas polymericola]TWT75682.1 hypothetical protein Pla123a_31920 [Posidoniimonas polymericola]